MFFLISKVEAAVLGEPLVQLTLDCFVTKGCLRRLPQPGVRVCVKKVWCVGTERWQKSSSFLQAYVIWTWYI